MQNIIAIENGVVRHPLYRMKKPINMTLAEGEHIAIRSERSRKKHIGRYYYRALAAINERSEV